MKHNMFVYCYLIVSYINPDMNNSLLLKDNASSGSRSHSPISSEGGSYPQELIDNFALNLHRYFSNIFVSFYDKCTKSKKYSSSFRIDKDVQRCDRNHPYFNLTNLDKLRNIITTYVWENLDVGYMQVRITGNGICLCHQKL